MYFRGPSRPANCLFTKYRPGPEAGPRTRRFFNVSIHSSFRTGSSAAKHRNVLSRLERLEKLEAADRWNANEDGLFGMPKVRSIKIALKKKKKKKDDEEDDKK